MPSTSTSLIKSRLRPLLLAVAVFLVLPLAQIQAGEIEYGTLQDVSGSTLKLRYLSPSGETFYQCDTVLFTCEKTSRAENETESEYRFIHGEYALKDETYSIGEDTYAIHRVYKLGSREPQLVGVFSTIQTFSEVQVSRDQNYLLGRTPLGGWYAFSLKNYTEISGDSAASLAAESHPYNTEYNSSSESYTIRSSKTGGVVSVFNGVTGSSPEFSESGELIALVTPGDFKGLILAKTDGSGKRSLLKRAEATLKDYVFVGETLFYLANENSQYEWSVYAYDYATSERREIARNASYGEWMQAIGNQLLFFTIDGKVTNPTLYNPSTKTLTVLRPRGESDTPKLSRRTIVIDGKSGVLLSDGDRARTLVVWLHGGPVRQTSSTYHSYFGYQVYDELLEKLVDKEKIDVLKLDYTGSLGYGKAFEYALKGEVGVVDVADVLKVAEEYTRKYDRIYLVGNSYGGYLALRTLAEGESSIAGAVSINGVINWDSIPKDDATFGGYFGTDEASKQAAYADASILERVGAIKDNQVLLVVGGSDTTVPPRQADELRDALIAAETNFTEIVYPNENHTIVHRQALNHLYTKILDFVSQ